MNLGYAIGQGMAAGAQSLAHDIDTRMKEDADARAANRDLDIKLRLKAADEAMTQRAEERHRAQALQQGKDIETKAQGMLAQQDASAINSSLGSTIDPSDPESARQLAEIRKNPAAAKAYNLPEDDEYGIAAAKRRADAARNIGDLGAAKELDTSVRTSIGEKTTKEKGERDERRLDILEQYRQAQEKRMTDLASLQASNQSRLMQQSDARAQEQIAREQRSATATALKDVTEQIKGLEKDAGSVENMDPAKQKGIRDQIDSMRREAEGYRRSLASAGIAPVAAPEVNIEPPPAAIDMLKKDPKLAPQFDAKYGKGKSDAILKSAPAAAAAPAAGGMMKASNVEPAVQAPGPVNERALEDPSVAGASAGVQYGDRRYEAYTDAQLWTLAMKPGEVGDKATAELKRRGKIGNGNQGGRGMMFSEG